MDEAEIVELWEERAAIIEEANQRDPFWRHRSAAWRRWESERLAFWDVKHRTGTGRMPAVTMAWMKTKVHE